MKRRWKLSVVVVVAVAVAALVAVELIEGGDSHTARPKLIPQPAETALNARTRRRLAPVSRRIDLVAPSFSPTSVTVTNPLFPVSRLRSAVLVGRLEGVPWRAETTLLPRTEIVNWNGQRVQALRSQFVAYLGGHIFEVAVDRYAQADDGSVWYLGEDAYTYEHGRIAGTEGTWLAGEQGPPAMIMPAHPRVGDVYRTENVPGLVFEQVTVEKTGETLNGPNGPVHGVMVGRELHMDEVRLERKVFAPGYGEFFSGGGRTYEATALVVPTDALSTPLPPQLKAIQRDALGILEAQWSAAAALAQIGRARAGLRPVALPKRLSAELDRAVSALAATAARRDASVTSLAAFDVANASLDLQLQHRPAASIDAARLRLWALRTASDARAGDRSGVRGDVATLGWIRDRLTLPDAAAARIDDTLRRLQAAATAGSLPTAASAAMRLGAANTGGS
jgi:hypothetical protein